MSAAHENVVIENHPRGYTRWNEESALERFSVRIGMVDRPWREYPCFKNRNGHWYIPDDILIDMAIAFAQAEPATVHLHLDVKEQELLREGFWLDELGAHRRLLRSKPAFAVVRQLPMSTAIFVSFVRSSSELSDYCGRLCTICESVERK